MAIEQKALYIQLNMGSAGQSGHEEVDFSRAIKTAWWCPFDNIGDIGKLHNITLRPTGNRLRVEFSTSPASHPLQVQILLFADVG